MDSNLPPLSNHTCHNFQVHLCCLRPTLSHLRRRRAAQPTNDGRAGDDARADQALVPEFDQKQLRQDQRNRRKRRPQESVFQRRRRRRRRDDDDGGRDAAAANQLHRDLRERKKRRPVIHRDPLHLLRVLVQLPGGPPISF